VAVTVNVYVVFVVSPVIEIGEDADVPVIPPGLDVAVYDVAGGTPMFAGGVKVTVAVVEPVAVAVPIVGAPGTDGQVPAAIACI
jgi:hypothetical protein